MPHIVINLYPGRNEKLKQEMAEKLQATFAQSFGFSNQDISVSVVEIDAEHFVDTINKQYKKSDLYCKSNYIK